MGNTGNQEGELEMKLLICQVCDVVLAAGDEINGGTHHTSNGDHNCTVKDVPDEPYDLDKLTSKYCVNPAPFLPKRYSPAKVRLDELKQKRLKGLSLTAVEKDEVIDLLLGVWHQ